MEMCTICGNTENNISHHVKEMQIGLNDFFRYVECAGCGCLWLADITTDLSRYYPHDYYSFRADEDVVGLSLIQWMKKAMTNHYYGVDKSLAGMLLCKIIPELLPPLTRKSDYSVFNQKILDVGCGNGHLLKDLMRAGFLNLHGVDLFIDGDMDISNGNNAHIKIRKAEIFDIHDTFDIIMFNHSLEHMHDHDKVLTHARKILGKGGVCIINIPTVSCPGWRRYKEFWFPLDAPRHLFIHSLESMALLSERCGFRMEEVCHARMDCSESRSRMYQKGWDVKRQNRYMNSPLGIVANVKGFFRSKYLNRKGMSDTVRIILKKSVTGNDAVSC